jgi:23S rRNA pseudouridine1911/1915/1917 synthase
MNANCIRIIAHADSPRLDKYLSENAQGISRSRARRLIELARVTLDGRHVKPMHAVSAGQEIVVSFEPEPQPALLPQDIQVDFIHIDDSLAVVNKPAGLVVHPAAGNPDGTLVNALLHHLGPLPAEGQDDRPGIVHRLDKDTSGVLVVARTADSLLSLQAQFARRTVRKEYLAITAGAPRPFSGTIAHAIGRHQTKRKRMALKVQGGREAETAYEVIEDYGDHALVRVKPLTGRTHQIRLHLRSLGTPVACDSTYARGGRLYESELLGGKRRRGEKPVLSRQALHARLLSFDHPATGLRVAFEAPLPADMSRVLELLRSRGADS